MSCAQEKDLGEFFLTTKQRANILRILDLKGSERVLVIGNDISVIVSYLKKQTREVLSFETGGNQADDLKGFEDGKGFDLLVLADADLPDLPDWPDRFASWTNLQSRILFAYENPYGLRGFAGCRDEQDVSLWGSNTLRIRSLQQGKGLLQKAGFAHIQTFFPYPDHLYASSIYSEMYLPKAADLPASMRNFRQPAITLFDEQKAYAQILEEGNYPLFSNAYVLLASREPFSDDKVLFVKCSNDRADETAIITRVAERPDGSRYVEKTPAGAAAMVHVQKLSEHYHRLRPIYERIGLTPNVCRQVKAGMSFEWLEGKTLAEKLEALQKESRQEEAALLLTGFLEKVQCLTGIPFKKTEDFVQVFGDAAVPVGSAASADGNIDLLLHNILFSGGDMHVIDYEWMFDFPVPLRYVLYRILYYYLISCGQEPADPEGWYARYGLTEEELQVYAGMEQHFQQWLRGGKPTVDALYLQESPGRLSLQETQELVDWEADRRWMRIWMDDVCILKMNIRGKTQVNCTVDLEPDTDEVTIQPFGGTGMLADIHIRDEEGRDIPWRLGNGMEADGRQVIFFGREPRLLIAAASISAKQLTVSWNIVSLDETGTAEYGFRFMEGQRRGTGDKIRSRLYREYLSLKKRRREKG